MNTRLCFIPCLLFLLAPGLQAGTPITYQGKLENAGVPYTGTVTLRMALQPSLTSLGLPIRTEVVPGVVVTDGSFTATLTSFIPADFSNISFFEIEVSSDGGTTYTLLSPRQRIAFTPLALNAEVAKTVSGSIAGSQISGTISPSVFAGGNVTSNLNFNPAAGSPFAVGNSTKITNLNGDLLDGLDSTAFLQTSGGTLTDSLTVANPAKITFGATPRQMVTLFDNITDNYGIGVQSGTEYFRTGDHFAWFKDGVHSDTTFDPGAGGTTLMTLERNGLLSMRGAENGYSLLNRSDPTKSWITYSEGTDANDSFRVYSGVTGDRLVVSQNGGTTISGVLRAGGAMVSGTLSATGFTTIDNAFYATGATTLGASLYVHDAATLNDTLSVDGVTTLKSTLNVTGSSTFENEVKSVGTLGGFSVNNRNNAAKRWVMYSRNSGGTDQLAFYSGTGGDVAALSPNGDMYLVGALSTTVLTIRGGADVAEPFEMSKPDEMEPGSVVVIDEANPGKLKLSTEACDTRVAGIISGAGGVQPGLRLHQEGVLEGDLHVALSGRVYVKADAAGGAIQPGDLLTTAEKPGHAMRVLDHDHAQGAILGKAMSRLEEGTGLVLVLVTLQ